MTNDRIATFLLHPNTWWGGAQLAHLRVATWLSQRGIPNEIIVSRVEKSLPFRVPESIELTSLQTPAIKVRNKPVSGMLAIAAAFKLAQYLRYRHPAILIGGGYDGWIAMIGYRLAKLTKVSTRFAFWEHASISARRKYASNLREFLAPLFARFYGIADALVACSQSVANELTHYIGLPREYIYTIYPPIALDLFHLAEEPVEHPWFVDKQLPVVLGVGRLTPEKNFETLIKAFALVRQSRPARLVILGEGKERPRLEALVRQLKLENDVSMPGFEPNPFKFMSRASVFVLSSRFEGFGMVIAEALACGCPVVSTDCLSGPSEILENGKWGKLVPVGDVETLAEAILETIENPPDREKLKQRGMDFHIDKIGQQWLELINSLTQKRTMIYGTV